MEEKQRLARLAREGEIKLGTGKIPNSFWSLPRPKDPTASVRRALEEDRRDRI